MILTNVLRTRKLGLQIVIYSFFYILEALFLVFVSLSKQIIWLCYSLFYFFAYLAVGRQGMLLCVWFVCVYVCACAYIYVKINIIYICVCVCELECTVISGPWQARPRIRGLTWIRECLRIWNPKWICTSIL